MKNILEEAVRKKESAAQDLAYWTRFIEDIKLMGGGVKINKEDCELNIPVPKAKAPAVESHKDIVKRLYNERIKPIEIARNLGISENSVYRHITNLRKEKAVGRQTLDTQESVMQLIKQGVSVRNAAKKVGLSESQVYVYWNRHKKQELQQKTVICPPGKAYGYESPKMKATLRLRPPIVVNEKDVDLEEALTTEEKLDILKNANNVG